MTSSEKQKSLTPGQLLCRAREEKDITIGTISQRLRLDPSLVNALENDDYDKFAAVAYVRGHLRGYAKIVELDSDEVIKAFDRNAKIAPSLEPFVSQPEHQAASGDRHIRAVTFMLIFLLILLVGLWWQTNRSGTESLLNHEQEADLLTENQANDEIPLPAVEEPALPVSENSQESFTSQAEPQELEHEFAVVQLSPLPEAPDLSATSDEQDLLDTDTVPVGHSADQSVDQKTVENQGIVMQFTDDAWVRVTDADKKKQYAGTGKAGEVVNVISRPPYTIVIGKASAVLMSYEGNFIDLQGLAKNEVARFKINEDGTIQ